MADSSITALNSMLRNAEIEDHEEALRLATTAVKTSKPGSPEQLTAHHARIVALLKLDRFDDALRAVSAAGTRVEDLCALESGYALYKTGQLAEVQVRYAQSHLNTEDPSRGRALLHLAAQVAYRAEKFSNAAEAYRSLSADGQAESWGEESDLRINVQAVQAQLEWQGNGHQIPDAHRRLGAGELETFETTYNAACSCIARGDLAGAALLLKRAKGLCELSDDLDDDEKATELIPITIQMAYVSAKMGKPEEAVSLQSPAVMSKVPDTSTRVVAHNNALILKAEGNPFMAQRLAQLVPPAAPSDRLFEYQSSILRRNKYVIELQAQKFSGTAQTTAHILADAATPAVSADKASLGVIHAGASAQLKTGKDALRNLLALLDTRPDDVGLLLTVIQLYVQDKNPAPALSLLESFFRRLEAAGDPDHADVRYAPGLVALAVSLYRLQGRARAIRTELAKAAAHWEKATSTEGSPSAPSRGDSLLREAGIELLRSSNPSDLAVAAAAFERLAASSRADRAAAAGLVAAMATRDFAKVRPHLASLSPVEKLTSGADIDALLQRGVAPLVTHATSFSSSSAAKKRRRGADDDGSRDAAAAAGSKKPKRRRAVRLPKDYDPNKKPDPERWLPLRDRSSYRPKGRKGRKRAAETTQGGAVRGNEDHHETLELVGGAGAVKVEKAGGASGVAGSGGGGAGTSSGGNGGGGGGAGGKKNKKKKAKKF